MKSTKFPKLASHESRATLTAPYLDEDPDIDLILPDPVEADAPATERPPRTKPLPQIPLGSHRRGIAH